jgi:acetyl esterase/lipase
VGEDEVLAEETRRLVARAQRSGTDARILMGPRMQHDWPLTLPWLSESRLAWRAIADFVAERASAFPAAAWAAPRGLPEIEARTRALEGAVS